MAELLNLRQAARLVGVSPGRLYRAIGQGRLPVSKGGGPGKTTLVSRESLQAWCATEGLSFPALLPAQGRSERRERSERSIDATPEGLIKQIHQSLDAMAGQYLARVMERQSAYFEAFLREELTHFLSRALEGVVDQLVARVAEHLPVPAATEAKRSTERSVPSLPTHAKRRPLSGMRQQIVDLLQQHPEGMSPAQGRQALRAEKDLADTMGGMARDGLLTRVEAGRYRVA